MEGANSVDRKDYVSDGAQYQNGSGEYEIRQNGDGYLTNGHANGDDALLLESQNGNGHILDNDNPGTPPPPEDHRDASSATTRRKQLLEEFVQRTIADARENGSICLQLKNKGIKKVPDELLSLSDLQYLYLEGNDLTSLPEDFFDRLPELRWLDLRRNYLASLPSAYIGSHRNLKTLLLEGNELKTLPLEIGLIPTLNGLNICNNPLEFPPTEVIERGTQCVLNFLRDLLKAKSQGKLEDPVYREFTNYVTVDLTNAPRMEDLALDSDSGSCSSDEWGAHRGHDDHRPPLHRNASKDSKDSGLSDSDLVGPVPTSAALHKPANYNEMKQKHIEKVRKAGALGTFEKKTKKISKKERRMRKVDRYPEPPSHDRVKQRFMEEQRLFREQEMNDKTDSILQKRRDHEELKKWRDDGKRLQMDRYREAMMYGGAKDGEKDHCTKLVISKPVDVATNAPFGIAKEHLKLPTNEERIAQAVKESHEKMRRRRALSPRSQARMEAERIARDKELEKRIKGHMLSMQDRRRAPKGTPQEEMEAARRELEIANQLQAEIEARRKNLEYRFTAFTGS